MLTSLPQLDKDMLPRNLGYSEQNMLILSGKGTAAFGDGADRCAH